MAKAKRPVHTLSHGGGLGDVAVITISDGRTTVTEIVQRTIDGWDTLGSGVAKRRKTDPNYTQYGVNLSAKRAFEDAAARLGKELDEFEKMSHVERRKYFR